MSKDAYYRELAEKELLKYHDLKKKIRDRDLLPINIIISLGLNKLTDEEVEEEQRKLSENKKLYEKKLMIVEYSVEQLDEKYKDIIITKYFKMGTDGKLLNDYYVHNKLNWSRSHYFRLKKEALVELGKLLNAHYSTFE